MSWSRERYCQLQESQKTHFIFEANKTFFYDAEYHTNCTPNWIEIYPVESVIHLSNKWTLKGKSIQVPGYWT